MKLWSWLAAWLLAFTADWRADLKVRIISARPSALLGSPAAWPANTVRAAASASMGSDLPEKQIALDRLEGRAERIDGHPGLC
jgi:hypothetical protein